MCVGMMTVWGRDTGRVNGRERGGRAKWAGLRSKLSVSLCTVTPLQLRLGESLGSRLPLYLYSARESHASCSQSIKTCGFGRSAAPPAGEFNINESMQKMRDSSNFLFFFAYRRYKCTHAFRIHGVCQSVCVAGFKPPTLNIFVVLSKHPFYGFFVDRYLNPAMVIVLYVIYSFMTSF